jgi:hypothetical protein
MISKPRRYWIAAAALAVAASGLIFFWGFANSPASRIKTIARDEIARQTRTPGSMWTLESCVFAGDRWHVEAMAPLGGRVSMEIAPDGTVVEFGLISPNTK